MKHLKTIEQEVIKFIKNNDLFLGANKILIGLSGGADSVFALNFFIKYYKKYNLKIAALHVNHNLRGDESKRDLDFCKHLCKNLNIEFYSADVNVKSYARNKKLSIEEAARILRYRELDNCAKNCDADLIITSHIIDDNTETVLLNLLNGTGLKGIAGIPVKRGIIERPFLSVAKSDIISYLNRINIEYVEDSSNENIDFKRNYLRKMVLPLLKDNINPAIDRLIKQSSEVFRKNLLLNEFFISEIVKKCSQTSNGITKILISELKCYPDEILGEVFNSIFNSNFSYPFSFNKFEKLKFLIPSQVGTQINLGRKLIAVRERGKIIIFKDCQIEQLNISIDIGKKIKFGNSQLLISKIKKVPQKFNSNKAIEFISGDKINGKMNLRNWKYGDKIQLLGMNGTKKISDVLTDLKVPSSERQNQLVLSYNNHIIWLVGNRINDKYKITKQTKSVLKLCLS